MKLTEEQIRLLKTVVDHFDQEDKAVRERQIRTWRRLKLFWDGIQKVWYSEVAHDWRVWEEQGSNDSDQSYYDKPVNIFRAYLESIIAALSVTVPPITCFPDDADTPLDIQTAKAGDKIAQLVFRHNNAPLLWVHALFLFCTEGMVTCYNYSKSDVKYGTYKEKKYKDEDELHNVSTCPTCNAQLGDEQATEDEFQPGEMECENCGETVIPDVQQQTVVVTRMVDETENPKSRQCLETYGGLNVKIPNYAKKQEDCPYLFFSKEIHYTQAREKYPDIREDIQPSTTGNYEPYERWGRISPQYQGEYPVNNVTERLVWLRPCAFEILNSEECKSFKKLFPNGVKVALIDDIFADAEKSALDDHWTLTYNPLADYIQHDPLGLLLTSLQEITNDLFSLILQTIEHGIPQTIADPTVLNFEAYRNAEVSPGSIIPGTPKSGKSMSDAFYEVRTASLSQEVLPFATQVQNIAQLVSGALPSLFGGSLEGTKTASEYSMSRAQARQRLQNVWKIFISWWKEIFGKVIPQYIKDVQDDEKYVERDQFGNFINVFIRRAELEGKLGNIELGGDENLPLDWSQIRDLVMQLLQANNPQIQATLATPENLPIIREAIGLSDFCVPGEDDRNKQYEEIKQLLNSEPIEVPPDPMMAQQALAMGQPEPQPEEQPSVEVDPIFDDHDIEFSTCRTWIISDAGQLAKVDNPVGYKNVLLHAKMHYQFKQQAQMQQAVLSAGAKLNASPKETNQEAPILGEENVQTQS